MNIGQVLVGAGAAAFPAASAGAAAAGRLAAATIGHAATSRSRGAGTVTIAAGGAPGGATQTAAQRQAEELGALLTRLVRGAITGTSTPATAGSSGTSGSLAFLKDSRLSVEEKLARLMAQLSDKYEKQLEQKLRQFGDLDAGKTGSPSSTKKSSSTSALSSLGSGLTSLLSKAGLGKDLLTGTFLTKLATQVAGPVLAGAATALGLPALAPLILKAGPLLGNVASGALAGLTGAATSGKSSTSKASTSSTSSTSSSSSADAPSEKQLMTEIQILQEKQKEMFTLVSNILRSLHDTKMAVIGNIR
ncbi:MAG TPA: hypothetical protein VLT61_17210 [Anaeromyxobacteraceae bacterium]|nr:hypothetical protein [Anaeromyxobacteraceae bacterium]